jgi:hypothetical protein
LALARFGLVLLTRAHLDDLPQLAGVGIHAPVLVFTLATSVLTSVLFGLAPALTGTRVNVRGRLETGRALRVRGVRDYAMRCWLPKWRCP